MTYPDVKPVRQKLRLVNPRKVATIKAEVEKLLKVWFHLPHTIDRMGIKPGSCQQEAGHDFVCMDFHDLNKACLKDNFPTPFIDQIVDECVGCEVFSFMDGFLGYNQIQIKPEDQHKMNFICPWGTFAYRKIPFGLKNVGATFQWAMSFSFHDLKHIVEAYLDDLASRSRKRSDHPTHLRLIFERCRYYQIHLNPNKCSFCVTLGHLLGFIMSTKGIMVDPLKVEVIVQFPPPCTIPNFRVYRGKKTFFGVLSLIMPRLRKGSCIF
jgi:hypothetical protein